MASQNPKDLVRTGYDSIAPSYLDFISKLPSPNIAWTDKFVASLPSAATAKVLELGCGNGIPCTAHLAPQVGHITANDISTSQIAIAKEKLSEHHHIAFEAGDMTQLTYPPRSFNAISALYSLIHLPLGEQPKMLHLIHSWLKPGGILLCNFDVEVDAGSVMDDWLGTKMFKAGHGTEESLKMVRETGFQFIETETIDTMDGKKTVPFVWVLARRPED